VKEGRGVLLEFRNQDLQRLYAELDFRLSWMGLDLTKQYRKKMALIANAVDERDLANMRSLRFEKLRGGRAGQYSVRLDSQYRFILQLRTDGAARVAVIIEVVDYH
jgi:proteic killer suppression protein